MLWQSDLSINQIKRYARQIILPKVKIQGQKALRMQKLVASLDQEGFEKIYESDFGEPVKYLLEILMHKPKLESELASSDVAEEVTV